MRAELLKFEQYKEPFKLLCNYKIDTIEQLNASISETEAQIANFTAERAEINSMLRRLSNDHEITNYKSYRSDLSAQITTLCKGLKIANLIDEQRERLRETITQHQKRTSKMQKRKWTSEITR